MLTSSLSIHTRAGQSRFPVPSRMNARANRAVAEPTRTGSLSHIPVHTEERTATAYADLADRRCIARSSSIIQVIVEHSALVTSYERHLLGREIELLDQYVRRRAIIGEVVGNPHRWPIALDASQKRERAEKPQRRRRAVTTFELDDVLA